MSSSVGGERLDFVNRVANLWDFIYMREQQTGHNAIITSLLLLAYFTQLCGLTIPKDFSSSNEDDNNSGLEIIYSIFKYSRLTPLLSTINEQILASIFVIACDTTFILSALAISKQSTRENSSKSKQKPKASSIAYVKAYYEWYRWVIYIPKLSLVFEVFLSSSSNNNSFSNSSENLRTFLIALNVLSLILTLLITASYLLIFNSAEFKREIPLKMRPHPKRVMEFVLVILLLIMHESTDLSTGRMVVASILSLFLLVEYILRFPIVDIAYCSAYLAGIGIFALVTCLEILRDSLGIIHANILIGIGVGSIFLYVLSAQTTARMLERLSSFSLETSHKFPRTASFYFSILIERARHANTNEEKYLLCIGMLHSHAQRCPDSTCPCKLKNPEEEKQVLSLTPDKHDELMKWTLKFIDYHMRKTLERLEKHLATVDDKAILEEIAMMFWFFAIEEQKNVIKALFFVKAKSKWFPNKSIFFAGMEIATSRIIENSVKTKDKSMKYSIRQRDAELAKQFALYEHMVVSESTKKYLKQNLVELLRAREKIMQRLIVGYSSCSAFFRDVLDHLQRADSLEAFIRRELETRKDNIEYLRLLSVLRLRIFNDPIKCHAIEKEIHEISEKDISEDSSTINAINILNGNVISIISGFNSEIATIIAFSEGSPNFFGYKKSEFQQLRSLNDLIPECIAMWHDNFMIRLVETGVSRIIRKYRVAIAKNQEGYMFPIKLYVNYFWHVESDFCFSALILKIKSESQFLLVDPNGVIKEMSQNFFSFFQELYPHRIDRSNLFGANVSLLFPSMLEIFENYQAHLCASLTLQLSLPKKLKQYLQDFKQKAKRIFKGNENLKESISDHVHMLSSSTYGLNYLSFDVNIAIKQENIQFYHGGSLVLYLIELKNYTPIIAAGTSEPNNTEHVIEIPNMKHIDKSIQISPDAFLPTQKSAETDDPGIHILLQDSPKPNIEVIQVIKESEHHIKVEANSISQIENVPQQQQQIEQIELPNLQGRNISEQIKDNAQYAKVEEGEENLDQEYEEIHIDMYDIMDDDQNQQFVIEKPNNAQDESLQRKLYYQYLSTSLENNSQLNFLTHTQITESMEGQQGLLEKQKTAEQQQTTMTTTQEKKEGNRNPNQISNRTQNRKGISAFGSSTKEIKTPQRINSQIGQKQKSIGGASNYLNYSKQMSAKSLSRAATATEANAIPLPFEIDPEAEVNEVELARKFKLLSQRSGTLITFPNGTTSNNNNNVTHHHNHQHQLVPDQIDEVKEQVRTDVNIAEELLGEQIEKKKSDLPLQYPPSSESDTDGQTNYMQFNNHENQSNGSLKKQNAQNAVSGIHALSNRKKMPRFLTILYLSYSIQWSIFLILTYTTFAVLTQQFNELQEFSQQDHFSSTLMVPISRSSIAITYLSLSKTTPILIPTINESRKSFFESVLSESYKAQKTLIDTQFNSTLQFTYQQSLFSSLSNDSQVSLIDFMSRVAMLTFTLIQDTSSILPDNPLSNLIHAYVSYLASALDTIDEQISAEASSIISSIDNQSLLSLMISIASSIVFFALIIPPFRNYHKTVVRMLMTVSRITELEAFEEIQKLKYTAALLLSETEAYLQTRFGQNEINRENISEIPTMSQMKQSMRNKKRSMIARTNLLKSKNKKTNKNGNDPENTSVYLNDRVRSMNLSFWLLWIIIFVLLLCAGIFAFIYGLVQVFLSKFSQPLSEQLGFSQAVRWYSIMGYSQHTLIASKAVLAFEALHGDLAMYSFDQSMLSALEDKGFSISNKFLLNDFLRMSVSGNQSEELRQYLASLNTAGVCGYFSEIWVNDSVKNNDEMGLCESLMNGVISMGFKNAITATLLSEEENILDSDVLPYVQTDRSIESVQVSILVMKMLLAISQRLINDNITAIDNIGIYVLRILIIGGCVVTACFLAISAYSLLRTRKNFAYLRKAVFLMPYQRLHDDSNTRFLLKKFIEV